MRNAICSVLVVYDVSRFLGSVVRSVVPSVCPVIGSGFSFSFTRVNVVALIFRVASSVLRPFAKLCTSGRPHPCTLSVNVYFALINLLLLTFTRGCFLVLLTIDIMNLNSSIFRPATSEITRVTSKNGGDLTRSVFRINNGKNSTVKPLLTTVVVLPFNRRTVS